MVLANSTNKDVNALQSVIGFFLELKQTPDIIVELLAHMGVSVSSQTNRNVVNSLTVHAKQWNKHLPPSQFIYDNFDVDLKVAQATAGKGGSHLSMTSATFAPYATIEGGFHLRYTKELYKTSHFNVHLSAGDPQIYTPLLRHVLPNHNSGSGLRKVFAWHLHAILIQQEPSFKSYESQLHLPNEIKCLPLVKTRQFPANAINADKGQNDSNWQVLESLLDQSGVQESTVEDNIILVHGDLSMKERIDALRKMRTPEKNSKNHLDFVIFVLGLFHLKMAATDVFWRAHVKPKAGQDDPTEFFRYLFHLRPKESGKFSSGPGFRRLHNIIHHILWVDVLDCWQLQAAALDHQSLAEFVSTAPNWSVLVKLSEDMVDKHLLGKDFLDVR